MAKRTREESRDRRQKRVRKSVRGRAGRPRLCVFRSSKHIYAQLIDDEAGVTLAAASTLSAAYREGAGDSSSTIEAAKRVGSLIAEAAKAKDIHTIVFDRNGFLYHGRVQAVADGAREAGLEF